MNHVTVQTTKLALLVAALACSTTACDLVEHEERADDIESVEQEATYQAGWTDWISEEDGQCSNCGAICPPGKVAVGVDCRGDFCDDVRLRCDFFPGLLPEHPDNWDWTAWIGRDRRREWCPDGSWLTGVKCEGDYCDNVSIRCSRSTVGQWSAPSGGFYSEETGPFLAPDGTFVTGIYCRGQHCDEKFYYTATARPLPGDSCQSQCGGQSSSRSCYCDTACVRYGDCCTDYVPACE